MQLSRGICIACTTYQGVWWLIGYSGQLFGQRRRMTYRDMNAHTGIISVCYDIHCISSTDASENEIWKLIIKPLYRNIAKCRHKQYIPHTHCVVASCITLSLFLHVTKSVCAGSPRFMKVGLFKCTHTNLYIEAHSLRLVIIQTANDPSEIYMKETRALELLQLRKEKEKARYSLFPIVV